MKLFRGADYDHHVHGRDDFDPVAEGSRYQLPEDESLRLWEQARVHSTDGNGRFDEDLARQRFHAAAMRAAQHGGRLRPAPGKQKEKRHAYSRSQPALHLPT